MITITEKAENKIKEISEEEGIETIIRVKCIGGGCLGFQFDLLFDNQINDLDEVFEQNNIKIICDYISLQYLENTSIDYIDNLISGGFKFNVPRAQRLCGCGNSYSF